MNLEEQAFWDTVFLKAFESALRSPQQMNPAWMIDASCQMADAALAERRKRIAQLPAQ
jgi:hypothetical protein